MTSLTTSIKVAKEVDEHVIPIIPRSGLNLIAASDGNDLRFASLFRDVWRQIPLAVRRRMYKHWRTDHIRNVVRGGPEIYLLNVWEARHGAGRDAIGHCAVRGHRLFFHAPTVDVLPDWVVSELIAHELAHVFQYTVFSNEEMLLGNDDYLESDAHEIEESWGFDPVGVGEWCARNTAMLSSIVRQ